MKITKNNQNGRSLLSNCCSGAKIFLSDVYKKGTQAKKYQADGQQCGRSMIEMLGVLAIIGVLSIGGIAGYSKAMEKYKLNKTINDIRYITQSVLTFCNGDIHCDTALVTKSNWKKFIAESRFNKNNQHVIGDTPVEVALNPGDFTFEIGFTADANSNLSKDRCFGLTTTDWSQLGLLYMQINENVYATQNGIKKIDYLKDANPYPPTIEQMQQQCTTVNGLRLIFSYI